MQPLELTGQRKLAFASGHRFTLSQITPAMWMKYYSSVVNTAETRDGKRFPHFEYKPALVELAMNALISAEGYKLPAGVSSLADVPDWKAKLPAGHRMALGEMLGACTVVEGADEAEFGFDDVTLQTIWNCDADGAMLMHRPLVHHFANPSFDQERRYRLQSARFAVVGGSKGGKTMYYGAQKVLVEIYDEVIQSVEGYATNGGPVEDPAKWMDTSHKVLAALQLFKSAPTQPVEEEEQPEAA